MNSCGTDNLMEIAENVGDVKLPLICLLPEWPPLNGTESAEVIKRRQHLHGLYTAFAERCDAAYVMTSDHGLIPFDEDFCYSMHTLESMPILNLHAWIIKVKGQLVELMRPGRRFVCLAGGKLLKSMRRMELNVIAPLTGMSERQRRIWLEGRLGESNFAIGFNLTGGQGEPAICAATPARSPATVKG